MPGAGNGGPERMPPPVKGATPQLHQAPPTHNGTLAPLACRSWSSSRCPNPHSVCALNTCVGVLRGFLPRGLCDTCPQVGGACRSGGVPGRYPTTLNRSSPSNSPIDLRADNKKAPQLRRLEPIGAGALHHYRLYLQVTEFIFTINFSIRNFPDGLYSGPTHFICWSHQLFWVI